MNFDNLMHYELMTGLYMLILFLILLFWRWPYSLHCVIQYVKEFKIHWAETVIEVSQKLNVKIVTYLKRKTGSKDKAK